MNFENITLQDCVEMHDLYGEVAMINDGVIIDFAEE